MTVQQRRLQGGGCENFEVPPPQLRVRVLGRDHLTLLGDANCALHSTAGLRQDRLVARTSAAAHRPATAVEQTKRNAVTPEDLDQRNLGLVELPARSHEAAVLVRVGIAEHHLLNVAARNEEPPVLRNPQEIVHDTGTLTEIRNGLEERHDVEIERAFRRSQQASLLQEHADLEHVRRATGLRDHVVGDRVRVEAAVRLATSRRIASSDAVPSEYSMCGEASGRTVRSSASSSSTRLSSEREA